jgi:hypothetical protein
MHFRLPKLFVMWDTSIRANYGFRHRTTPQDYVEFRKRMQSEFGHLNWTRRHKRFPKAIVEYNSPLAVVTLLLELIFRRQPCFGGSDHGLEAGIVAEWIEVWIDLGVV